MRKMFPEFKDNIINDDEMRSIFNVLQGADRDFDKVNIIVGSDRQAEFENLAQKYNGELYNFSEIKLSLLVQEMQMLKVLRGCLLLR